MTSLAYRVVGAAERMRAPEPPTAAHHDWKPVVTSTKTTSDPERVIADEVMAAIEAGAAPWRKPWMDGAGCPFPPRHTGEGYRGIDVLMPFRPASLIHARVS